MRLTKYFLPMLKETPEEASIISHQLMLRAGMIRQVTAGIYSWLPIGLTALHNIENIIRKRMNMVQCNEVLMPCIQPAELWRKSGRYGTGSELDTEMLKIVDRYNKDLLFTPTAEELVVTLFGQNTASYKALPSNLYQIGWKFRDEIRPRFGVMRGREFLMKDAYSFDIDKDAATESYHNMFYNYINIFKDLGLCSIPVAADPGDIGGDFSHEFHILADTGESTIYCQSKLISYLNSNEQIDFRKANSFYAVDEAKHLINKMTYENKIPEDLVVKKGIEVGHLFYLGDKYSKLMNIKLQGKDGKLFYPVMGCYGIGVSRLVAAVIEASHDDRGIIWPEAIAPFKAVLINLGGKEKATSDYADSIYHKLQQHIATIYDDTHDSAGAKFAKADLIGIPWQIIIGKNSMNNDIVELKNRKTKQRYELSIESILTKLTR